MAAGRYFIIVSLVLAVACRGNPFGETAKSIEEFNIYTSDFTAQNDGGMKSALLEVINGSRATLNCAFSALTQSDITNALIARSRAGVQVRIAFDADVRDSDYGSLALQASGSFIVVATPGDTTQGQLLYGNSGTGAMRHNFCLSDERHIWLSTAAPDDAQMNRTPNVAITVGSPQFGLARDFLRESSMFSQLLFGNGKARTDYTTKFAALDQVIAAYWGPQEDPMDVLGTELSEATKTVDLYSTSFEATNTSSTKSYLDVPTVLKALESAKGVTIRKYFSSQALFDTASKAYTLNNPAQYVNTSVRIGPNIFVVDRGQTSARTFIYTGSLRTQANSSDDSVLIELRGKRVTEVVGAYLDRIGAVAVVASNTGDVSVAGAVVINEINWAGSYSNSSTSDTSDEFLELYNTTSSPINISGWRFACTTDGGTTVSSHFQLPAGGIIPANGYFTVASKSTGAFTVATFFSSSLSITNSSKECKLTNGKAAASSYAGAPTFTGDVIDTAGDGTTSFDSSGNVMGMNDSSAKIRRSMERKQPVTAGTSLGSWQSNVNSVAQNTEIAATFNQKTFGTPGTQTSVPVPSVAFNRTVYFTTAASHPNGLAKLTAVNVAANTNAASIQTVTVTATSTTDGTGISLILTETGNNTGIFTTAATGTHLQFTTGASAGNQLKVSSGDTVTLTYTYAGSTYNATAQWFQQSIMINEIGSNCGSTTANDYIEIFNPNAQAVNLAGMTLYRDSGTSGTACTIGPGNFTSSVNLSGTLAANGYAIAAGSTYAAAGACPAADFTGSSAISIDDSDCLALVLSGAGPTTATDDEVVDFVGMGNASNVHEGGGTATDLGGGNNQCISRNPNGTDTNANNSDFTTEATLPCSPRGANGSLSVVSAATGNGTALEVTFNGAPNSGQAQTAGNYCIALASAADCSSPALTVSSPTLTASTVLLTTSTQAVGTSYRIYVTGVTLSSTGGAILAGTATFTGAAVLPNLKINEVGVSSASNDFVEIYNPTSSAISLTGLYLQRDSTCNLSNGITETLALSGSVPAGGYYVLANSGNSLSNVDSATLGNIASGYCIILTANSNAVTAANNTNVIDFVAITGATNSENSSVAPDTGTNGAISRMPNGSDTNMNASDFALRAATPGLLNGTPTYSSSPASGATGVAINTNVVLTFSEAMNTSVGTVTVNGATSGNQSGLSCAWSMTTVANDTCTINPPADFSNTGESVTVTLSSFVSQANSLTPAPLSFSFTTVNAALTPTVTNVVVASTNPNNGTTPYNTGTATLTITGTNFTGVTCPAAVKLNDPATTTATACTVDSATQITATLPAGIRTNGATGWDVRVTTSNGTNTTSTVTFKPVAGLLITEVGDNYGASTNNDYIEIFNPTAQDINLSSYRWMRDSSCALAGGWSQSNVTFGAITTIVSRKYLLISRTSNTISGDLTTLTAMANSHCVALTFGGTAPTSAAGSNIIDFVSFGTVTDSENSSLAPNLPVNGAIRRNGTCKSTDSDLNANDFTAIASPAAPNNSASLACP